MAEAVVNQFEEDIKSIERVLAEGSLCSRIHSLHCEAGSNIGDNYMSLVKKVEVTGVDENEKDYKATLIVKRQIPSLSRRQLYRCDEAFDNEIRSYQHVVPFLETKLDVSIFAKCYFAGRDEHGEMIILEDLRTSGFGMENRLQGLDMIQLELVMRELARVHAASIFLKQDNLTKFNETRNSIREIVYTPENYAFYKGVMATSIREALASLRISNVDGKLTHSIAIIEKLEPDLFDMVYGFVNRDEDDLNVITHGDLWINNIMFKKDEANKPIAVKFFDLQAMRYASPIFDIMHLVYTSTKRGQCDNSMKTILGMYCNALHRHLESIFANRDPEELIAMKTRYCYEALRQEYFRSALYGLAISMWILPAVTFDPNNIPNLDRIADKGIQAHEINMSANLTPDYHTRLRDIVWEFYNKGHLRDDCVLPKNA